ncbi:MAG: acetolactate synthase small subunit [Deltaproteobacteria bacterium]|jgi:acetolactate synthase-1/3 small subunit|nr:acetolactate synthase small subunit [Deltaproteobacteria bacterium]
METRFTIGLLVENRHGVLNKIAGLYSKRGYGIDSLAASGTENPAYSRITIVSRGDGQMRTQVVRQLNKLCEVKKIAVLEDAGSVAVEHLLIKIKTGAREGDGVAALVAQYGGRVMDRGERFLVADVAGAPETIQEFIEKCRPIGIYELCRSGALALSGGTNHSLSLN